MTRRLVTADDILAVEPGGVVEVCPNTLVTPLARDVARERGVTLADTRAEPGRPAAAPARPEPTLEDRIRRAVEQVLGSGGGTSAPTRRQPPVKLARGAEVTMTPFPFPGPPPGMQVAVGDVVTTDDGSPVGAGYMTITKGSFEWTLDYDEVQVVLEGELVLGGDGGGRVARAGDVFFVPKGSTVEFSTPTWARFVYITYPADWGG